MTWRLIFTDPDGNPAPCDLWGVDELLAANPNTPLEDLVAYCVVPIPPGHTVQGLEQI